MAFLFIYIFTAAELFVQLRLMHNNVIDSHEPKFWRPTQSVAHLFL